MLKYLKKYGGVSFDEQPLNDVDRLVFAQMAYVDFPADARRDVPLSEILGRQICILHTPDGWVH